MRLATACGPTGSSPPCARTLASSCPGCPRTRRCGRRARSGACARPGRCSGSRCCCRGCRRGRSSRPAGLCTGRSFLPPGAREELDLAFAACDLLGRPESRRRAAAFRRFPYLLRPVVFGGCAVHEEHFVPHFHHVARERDHSLDESCAVGRGGEGDCVTALGFTESGECDVGERELEVVAACCSSPASPSACYGFVIAYTMSPTKRLNDSFSTNCL